MPPKRNQEKPSQPENRRANAERHQSRDEKTDETIVENQGSDDPISANKNSDIQDDSKQTLQTEELQEIPIQGASGGSATTGNTAATQAKRKDNTISKKSKINPFRKMVRHLGKLLNDEDVNEIAFLSSLPLEIIKSEDCQEKPLYSLITALEEQGKVTENDVDLLIDIFEEMELGEALRLVEDYRTYLQKEGQASSTEDCNLKKPTASKPSSQCQERNTSEEQLKSMLNVMAEIQLREFNSEYFNRTHILQNIKQVLTAFGIREELSIIDCMTLDELHLNEGTMSPRKVAAAFLTRLISFDYRAMRLFKELEPFSDLGSVEHTSITGVGPDSSSRGAYDVKLSCRDITFLILNACNPFLRQEILSKMAHCQLAVPILLPNLDQSRVSLLLWGLLRLTKAWRDPQNPKMVHEKAVTKFPFPIVSALRLGKSRLSKSNILNKMLGQIQDNDDHPYFFSSEQDSCPSILSKGTLEGVWYLPCSRKKGKYSLLDAACILNLRGDAEHFPKQRNYIRKVSSLTIVFVRKGDLLSKADIIQQIALNSKVIAVIDSQSDERWAQTETNYGRKTATFEQIITFESSKLSTLDIGEYLCKEINNYFLEGGEKSFPSLESSLPVCSELGLDADILESVCSRAKKAAKDIINFRKEEPKTYKSAALPLQFKWQTWSQLDKDRSWTSVQGNTERQLANLHRAKEDLRKQQREIGMSQEIKKLYQELCNPAKTYKQYLVFWLQHFLNEKSVESLRPLVNTLNDVRDEVRETAAKITTLKRRLDETTVTPDKDKEKMERTINDLSTKEAKLHEKLTETTREFDASSLGFEHFVRELGQLYECFYSNIHQHEIDDTASFDVKCLPKMAAEMLLNGHPIEIFDGDACHVPIKWIKGILSAVCDIVDDCRIYVISVIGIQSSGKSTLLNSMFGVRFAVSAGRCTRGVFLQLLPIADNLKQDLGCDYVAVIDTEGLKAPEKAIANRKNEDNELATFSLCLSDMTLINIAGQTVGEDLSNILQIAAHAFIRMKEVNLRSSCYLIQQFVADVTASQRNQSSTQSILQTLDQAVITAAMEERKQDQYRQFSDCFNIVNLDGKTQNVQYFPSLWRTSMSAPNYEYSETVLQLKSALLGEVKEKGNKQKISEFADRIDSVWNAVKQEDFVFNFRNTIEIAQYNNFTFLFKREQLKFTNEMIQWELDAKQKIRNTTAENVINRRDTLFQELNIKLTSAVDKLHETINEELRKREYENVRHHATYFTKDVEMLGKQVRDTIRQMLNIESSIITDAKTKETDLLPTVKAKLRQQVLPVAEKLKQTLSNRFEDNPNSELAQQEKDREIETAFESEWLKQMKDVQINHPTDSEEEIRQRIESNMTSCIRESLESTDLSMEMKTILSAYKLSEICHSSPDIKSVEDIAAASTLIRSCTNAVTRHLCNLVKIVQEAVSQQKFLFSFTFVKSIRELLRNLVIEPCVGCKDKTELLVSVLCKILWDANHITMDNILTVLVSSGKLLKEVQISGVFTKKAIERNVASQLKILKPRVSSNFMANLAKQLADKVLSFFSHGGEMEENFHNHLHAKLQSQIVKHERKRWYSEEATTKFLKMALKLIDETKSSPDRAEELLTEACSVFMEAAIKCEKDHLFEVLDWDKVKKQLKIDAIMVHEQRDLLVATLKDILPIEVSNRLQNLQQDEIQKYAQIPMSEQRRHVIDWTFMTLVPYLSVSKYDTILSIMADSQVLFLGLLRDHKIYNPNAIKSVITTTMGELSKSNDLEKPEQALSVAFICSWALPIWQAMEVTFLREHSMQYLLEQEKELLHSEFRELCLGACQDQLEAKSLCSVIESSLKETIMNRICGSLFERLSKTGDEIFCSRSRFLQAILEELCIEENFDGYTAFVCQHDAFIADWTLHYIAKQCCKTVEETGCISISDIAKKEINQLLCDSETSLKITLQSLTQSGEKNNRFQHWLNLFITKFENIVKSTLNEERLSELTRYICVTDFELFTNECVDILKKFSQSSLVDSIDLPNENDLSSLENWFQTLPKQIHQSLAQSVRGCGSRCPFCKTFCDDTVKEHAVHFSNLHFPSGIGGAVYKRIGTLASTCCTAFVASDSSYYNCGCGHYVDCGHPTTPYKEYKRDFPDWDIRPISDYEPTFYWKWVLTRFNSQFAQYYNGKPATIPWGEVTKKEALSSVRSLHK